MLSGGLLIQGPPVTSGAGWPIRAPLCPPLRGAATATAAPATMITAATSRAVRLMRAPSARPTIATALSPVYQPGAAACHTAVKSPVLAPSSRTEEVGPIRVSPYNGAGAARGHGSTRPQWRGETPGEKEGRTGMSDDRKLAMFIDFENIVRGVKEAQYKAFEIKLVLERLVEKGKIMVKRAYADWSRYQEYKRPFHEHAVELIDVPQSRYSGKNSADIRMVVDAMDLAYAKQHVDTFALVSGDSDFSPLVSKLRENDRYVIGIGVKSSSSELLVGNCDEFIFYEDLIRESKKTTALRGLPEKKAEAFSQLIEAVLALQRENKDTLWGSMVKQTMIRKNPAFSESYYGYSTFSKLLEEAAKQKILTLEKDAKSGTYIITSIEEGRAA
jgi:uncharacterized protein (TIGR00288 family)